MRRQGRIAILTAVVGILLTSPAVASPPPIPGDLLVESDRSASGVLVADRDIDLRGNALRVTIEAAGKHVTVAFWDPSRSDLPLVVHGERNPYATGPSSSTYREDTLLAGRYRVYVLTADATPTRVRFRFGGVPGSGHLVPQDPVPLRTTTWSPRTSATNPARSFVGGTLGSDGASVGYATIATHWPEPGTAVGERCSYDEPPTNADAYDAGCPGRPPGRRVSIRFDSIDEAFDSPLRHVAIRWRRNYGGVVTNLGINARPEIGSPPELSMSARWIELEHDPLEPLLGPRRWLSNGAWTFLRGGLIGCSIVPC